MSKQQDMGVNIKARGFVKIVERLTATGEIIGTYGGEDEEIELGEENIVLDQGKTIIIQGFTTPAGAGEYVETIKIGTDVGTTGTVMEPDDPTGNMTELDQTVIYTIPTGNFSVSYPTATSVQFIASIDGATVMAGFPTQPNIIYTSAALYTDAGTAITYKRFPARTISPLISVDITWTLTLN